MIKVAIVPLKKAQKVRKFIIENDLSSSEFKLNKDSENLYIPVKAEFEFEGITIENREEKDFTIIELRTSPKDFLKEQLTEEEQSHLKTSFDALGTIAIIEVDKELEKKEKIIGNAILESNPAIKTVVKKVGHHGGEFRTQKVKVIAGADTKESIYKENGISLKLNVEEVYFSPRLSTERKRIADLVKPGEDVLVMFSGCAPYPCVLAKNTEAKSIVGIEINPVGHKYGVENIRRNKIDNTILYNGDVRKVLPVKKIGLKGWWSDDQIQTRLKKNPGNMEFFLKEGDLENHFDEIKRAIEKVNDKHIIIHQPYTYNGTLLRLDVEDENEFEDIFECYRVLSDLCAKYSHVKGFICHSYGYNPITKKSQENPSVENAISRAKQLPLKYAHIENSTVEPFCKLDVIRKIAKASGSNRVCIDLCHLYMNYKGEELINEIKKTVSNYNTYFHISDSIGQHNSFIVGKGDIDWECVAPLISKGIIEVVNKDENNPIEAFESFDNPMFDKKFDRILMPLPKSAEDFLDVALEQAKDGAVVHFYDFLEETKFEEAHEKLDKACKKAGFKYEILRTVKCGQHAPHVFRICVDVIVKLNNK
jgi:tRNA (guanine37-N1)-methyltransferase